MSAITISGNETSGAISFTNPGFYEIRLRADSLASGFEGKIQRADIGSNSWQDVYLDYDTVGKFNTNVREYVATGNAKYRVVTTGYSDSSNVYISGYELVSKAELTEQGLDDVREEFLQDPAANQGQIMISQETGSNYTFWNYKWLKRG